MRPESVIRAREHPEVQRLLHSEQARRDPLMRAAGEFLDVTLARLYEALTDLGLTEERQRYVADAVAYDTEGHRHARMQQAGALPSGPLRPDDVVREEVVLRAEDPGAARLLGRLSRAFSERKQRDWQTRHADPTGGVNPGVRAALARSGYRLPDPDPQVEHSVVVDVDGDGSYLAYSRAAPYRFSERRLLDRLHGLVAGVPFTVTLDPPVAVEAGTRLDFSVTTAGRPLMRLSANDPRYGERLIRTQLADDGT